MDAAADRRYASGQLSYTVAWVLLTFLGILGIHRFYMGKYITGALWLVTGGLVGIGLLYDMWTLNEQVDALNREVT
ncbi:MAG: TM2 domain-containing protein [Leptospiraceae bacterium]|nr:TM2 domain-containing protein [Leptospiraceae bacterium]